MIDKIMSEEDTKITEIAGKVAEHFFKMKSPWQTEHEATDLEQFTNIHNTLKKQDDTLAELKRSNELIIKNQKDTKGQLDPMVYNFKVTKTLGKWIFAVVSFLAILFTFLSTAKQGVENFTAFLGHLLI